MTADDRFARLEQLLGRLLITGVIISACSLLAGLLTFMAGLTAAGMLLRAGLWVLMATPVLRVAVSFVEYVRQRDWFFALTTLAVLSVLATTMLVALKAARS